MSIRESEGNDRWPERVRMDGSEVRTAFRVRYAETDQMGMAYYANYLVWFEVVRGDFMRAVGMPYSEFESQGIFLPVTEATVRYRSPARYDDPIEIVASIEELRTRRVVFVYRVEREGRALATGSTTHMPMDREGKPRSFPEGLFSRLQGYCPGRQP